MASVSSLLPRSVGRVASARIVAVRYRVSELLRAAHAPSANTIEALRKLGEYLDDQPDEVDEEGPEPTQAEEDQS